MKAICVSEFGGPEVLKLEDMPDPRPPQSGGVLVSVNAAGVTEESGKGEVPRMKTLGIVGGIGPESTTLLYVARRLLQ
jgi:D-arabinose 1-dehydrogenase-like Zn-dependent alcohol dehydrogenase